MEVAFRLIELNLPGAKSGWWESSDVVGNLLEIVGQTDFANDLNYFCDDKKATSMLISRVTDVTDNVSSWTQSWYRFVDDMEMPGLSVGIGLRPTGVNFHVRMRDAYLDGCRETALTQFETLGRVVNQRLSSAARLGPDFNVALIRPSYPRPRPPRVHPRWSIGSVLDFYSKSYRKESDSEEQERFRKLCTESLPPGVSREEDQALVTIRWVEDLSNDADVISACSMQEEWLGSKLDLPIQAGFNELGDGAVSAWGLTPKEPFTFYDEQAQIGYKSLVLTGIDELDGKLLGDLEGVLASRELPDGTPVSGMSLILPSRLDVLRIKDSQLGQLIEKALYMDSGGTLWDVDPPGNWLDITE